MDNKATEGIGKAKKVFSYSGAELTVVWELA
jgi:hypothetical protein